MYQIILSHHDSMTTRQQIEIPVSPHINHLTQWLSLIQSNPVWRVEILKNFYEVPITYNCRSYEEGKKIGLKDAFIALKTIILYSFKN